ncbi:MAG: hypothetical protein RSD54_08185 [Ruthenibacterium sp.]
MKQFRNKTTGVVLAPATPYVETMYENDEEYEDFAAFEARTAKEAEPATKAK